MQKEFKSFDRLLNVILVIVALAWAYDHFIRDKPERKAEEAQALSSDAQAAFNESQTSEVMPSKKGVSQPVTFTPEGITPIDFDKASKEIMNSDVPVLVFIHASWCPYCNKLYPIVESVANEQLGNIKVLALSIDKSEYAFQRYINSKPSTSLTPYYLGNGEEYSRMMNFLQLSGFNFNGAIPFMAFFSHGKPAGQIGGFVEKDKIDQILQQIYADSSTPLSTQPSL